MDTIKQGSRGNSVKAWQKIIGVSADGIFGSGTAAKTKSWQSAHGISPDGVVGPQTWAAATVENAAQTVTSTSSSDATIKQGSKGTSVKKWQGIIGVPADGIFGAKTTAATKTWQLAHGITPDGVVGPVSWSTANAVQTVSAAVPSIAQAIPAITQAVQAAYADPASVTISPAMVPSITPSVQSSYQAAPSIASILPPVSAAAQDSSAYYSKPAEVPSLVSPDYQLPEEPSGSANVQVPGLGNVSLQTQSQTAIDTAAEDKKKLYLYGGIGAGILLLGGMYMYSQKSSRR